MTDYLIVDSNRKYAERLYSALAGSKEIVKSKILNPSTITDLSSFSDDIVELVKNKTKTIVLINAEGRIKGGYLQSQSLVDLAFWLRCKHTLRNSIVYYSLQSINQLLQDKPQHIFLLSPGCYHFRLPLTYAQLKRIGELEPLDEIDSIRPFLKPRISLEGTRHRYANYVGMVLMMLLAGQVWKLKNEVLTPSGELYSEVAAFLRSLDFHLLKAYFKLSFEKIPEQQCDALKTRLATGKLLLVDDLANNGWRPIVGQVVYGDPVDNRLNSLALPTKKGSRQRPFDVATKTKELEALILTHKPHAVLLDLRLQDEEGRRELSTLGGFRMLKHIKAQHRFRGLPVIMFTASSNAETIKELLEAGAEAVWTKPGLDEGLTSEAVVRRYKQLVTLINNSVQPNYELLHLLDDNTDGSFDINGLDFEAIRNLLLRRLDLIKYRLELYSGDELMATTPEPYKSADAIYVDANILLKDQDYADMLCSVYKLSILTANSDFRYKHHSKVKTTVLPKVVIMNSIFDEIIKIAKKGIFKKRVRNGKFEKNELRYLRAMLSQLLLKHLFTDRLVRSELSRDSINPQYELMNPKENVYADGYILDELADLLITRSSKQISYCDDLKIVFISGDNKLKQKLERLSNEDQNLIIKDQEEFLTDMSNVLP